MVVDGAVLSDARDLVCRQVRRRGRAADAPAAGAAGTSPSPAAAAGRHEERVGGRAPQLEAFGGTFIRPPIRVDDRVTID